MEKEVRRASSGNGSAMADEEAGECLATDAGAFLSLSLHDVWRAVSLVG